MRLDDPAVQKTLEMLFPGHKKGSEYRLPTEAEWEFVARDGGLAYGRYSHGNSETDIDEYAWRLGTGKTYPVGRKRPIFHDGKPIYDLQGNVFEMVSDWYGPTLLGSTDPTGMKGPPKPWPVFTEALPQTKVQVISWPPKP